MQAPARIRGADFAQPWHADAAERQLLEAERRHSTLMMTAAADGAWRAVSHRTQRADDILAIQDRNRILQVELNRLREEKATVEAEAQAFKQRMESAVSSFEVIIEQAVQEKANTFQQLVETRQRLKQSQRQQRTAAAKAGPKQLTRVFRICESRDTAVALARWRGFAGELRHDRAAEKIASFEAAARETVREREEEELLRSQLQCAVQRLAAADGAREEEQRKAEEARSARAEAEERLAGARVDLAESKESLRSLRAAFSAESVALSGESTALARRASELQGQLADAEHRAAQANERACELQAELERRAETWSLAAPGKVDLMRQMLHEQQEELAEARRFSAACKLVTAVGRRDTLSLSTALGAWRRACSEMGRAELREQLAATAAREQQRTAELHAQLSASEGRVGAETWSLAAPGKVGLMRQMLHEQQEELAEARRFSAACKLVTAVGRRDTLSLSTALGAWRRACSEMGRAELREQLAATAAREQQRTAELHAQLSASEGRVGAETWSLAAPGKVDLMRQMLHEQQEELAEARRFSAACKLVTAVGRRDTLSLSTALGAWRRACLLAREADLRHTPRLAKPAAEGLPFIPLASLGEAAAGISRDSPGRSSPPSQPPSGSLASPPSRLPPSQLRPRQVSPTAGDTPSTLPTMHSLETL